MSSDVRRTTIEDRLAEALRVWLGKFYWMRDPRDLSDALAEYDRTRPPEAARSPEPDDDDDPQPGVNTRTSPSPDPRGRSGETLDAPALVGATLFGHGIKWSTVIACAQRVAAFNGWKGEMFKGAMMDDIIKPPAAPATTGVHVAHCCIKHGCKYGNPNCPVASGELAGDGSCESCADEPATTGARAEEALSALNTLSMRLGNPCLDAYEDETLADALVRFALDRIGRLQEELAATPEVTHGAAIGGDVVTCDRETLVDTLNAMTYVNKEYVEKSVDTAIAAYRARATASTRPDGGDVGRDAK